MIRRTTVVLLAVAMSPILSGCIVGPRPHNRPQSAWMLQQQPDDPAPPCLDPAAPAALAGLPERRVSDLGTMVPLLAPGDRLRLRIPNDEDRMTGLAVIGDDGTLPLPGMPEVRLAGLTIDAAKATLARAMTRAGLIRPVAGGKSGLIDLRLVESAGVNVAVSGAVFDPGLVRAGERSAEALSSNRQGSATGDANPARSVAIALRAAGGVRPDADVAHVYLLRDGRWTVLDLTGVVGGTDAGFVPVSAGDRLIVPSRSCFQPALARPSPITPPGIRVYMSNLTRPANNNASSAIGSETTSLPYGTRMLQALVAMNCVGGSPLNAHRRAVLISTNPLNGKSIVVERAIEGLVRQADRDERNPYLMPADALACYDSRLMSLSDAIGLVAVPASLATPLLLLRRTSN